MWNKIHHDILFDHRRIQNYRTSHQSHCALGTISIRQKWTFISIESISWSEGSKRLTEVCSIICVAIKSKAEKIIKDVLNMERRCEIRKLNLRLTMTISSIDLRTPSVLTELFIPYCSTFCSLTLIPITIGNAWLVGKAPKRSGFTVIRYGSHNSLEHSPL